MGVVVQKGRSGGGTVAQDERQRTAWVSERGTGAGIGRGGGERTIQDSWRDQGVDRVGVWSELPVGKCVQSA